MRCPHCQSERTVKNGTVKLQDQSLQQRYRCQACSKRFNERTNTPMARLRTPSTLVSGAIKVRTEGLGVRATGRSLGKAHATIIRWERRLSAQVSPWSPLAPDGADARRRRGLHSRGREPAPPLNPQVGQSTSLSGRPVTGSLPKPGTNRTSSLSKGQRRLGSGRNLPNLFGGSLTASDATEQPCGNLLVSRSKQVRLTQTRDDVKCGVKVWKLQ